MDLGDEPERSFKVQAAGCTVASINGSQGAKHARPCNRRRRREHIAGGMR
jgi:hypothetical protein